MRPRKASVVKDLRNPECPWVVRWSESTEDGRRVRKVETFRTQREADRFANRKTRQLRGELIPSESERETEGGLGDTPLGVFVEEYLRRRRPEVRPATLDRCRETFDLAQ